MGHQQLQERKGRRGELQKDTDALGVVGDRKLRELIWKPRKKETCSFKRSETSLMLQRERVFEVFGEAYPEKLLFCGNSFNCLNILRVVSEKL